jgi:hypothetical protein
MRLLSLRGDRHRRDQSERDAGRSLHTLTYTTVLVREAKIFRVSERFL